MPSLPKGDLFQLRPASQKPKRLLFDRVPPDPGVWPAPPREVDRLGAAMLVFHRQAFPRLHWSHVRHAIMSFLSTAGLAALTFSLATFQARAQERKPYVEGDVIVIFKSGQSSAAAEQNLGKRSMRFAKRFLRLSERQGRQTGLVRDKNRTTAELVAELQADASVELVEPNYLRWVDATPNDTHFGLLWGLRNTGQTVDGVTGASGADIKFLPAQILTRTPATLPVVGILDTGIDRHHPDLLPNLWVNPGEVANNGVDDDGNGCVDDVHGYDFTANNNGILDSGYHGTHVAGTIGAAGNNQTGVIGVNPQVRLMTLKVSDDGTSIDSASVLEALNYVLDLKTRGVNVVALNASFGGGSSSTSERNAITACGNAGIVFCAAAGNDASNNNTTPVYPAGYRLSNMLVVAATDQNDALGTFSNYGATTVDLAAPGVNIYSTAPGAITTSFQGGSTTYATNYITYAGTGAVTGTLHACGIGNPGDFPTAVNGNIALIQRGTLTFAEKVANAMAAGARAAVIYNNATGNFNGTLGTDRAWIPAVSISQANGATLLAAMPASATVTITRGTAYQYLDGTSMAAPHVTAAVSLAAVHFPEETAVLRVQRLLTTVDTRTALNGKVATGGRLNLQRMLDTDANGLPDWWEKEHFNVYTGSPLTGDADLDGLANAAEFFVGTHPKNAASVMRILSMQRSQASGAVNITLNSVPGRTYQLQANTTLLPGGWADVGASTTANDGQTLLTLTENSTGAFLKRFYRVRVVTE